MAMQQYLKTRFQHRTAAMIMRINEIIDKYIEAGMRLTARQIFYQLVAHHGLPNTEKNYRNTTRLINDAKLAGVMDWEAIEDRTRQFLKRSRWSGGKSVLESAASSFHVDMWDDQPGRVFVVVEKEALVGVLEKACHTFDTPLLAARGYPSGSVLREFCVEDVLPAVNKEQDIIVIHLGDHDPSGLDMSRDLYERISMFAETSSVVIDRIALNMDQIKRLKPPPNPARDTDARFKEYARKYGHQSWELDALDPSYIDALVSNRIKREITWSRWEAKLKKIARIKRKIVKIAKGFK